MRTRGAMLLAVLAAAPYWGDREQLRILAEIFTYVALASLWNLLAGYAGLVSVGQQAFVGFGGYPTLPPLLAASRSHVPTVIHEQNAVLGRVNRFMATRVGAVACAFPTLEKAPPSVRAKVHVVGNPVRPDIGPDWTIRAQIALLLPKSVL